MNAKKNESVLVQLGRKIVGPVPVHQLSQLKGFSSQALVSFPGSEKWAPAYRVLKMNLYEPPVARYSGDYQPRLSWQGETYPPNIPMPIQYIEGPVGSALKNEAWVDKWFWRMAIFHLVLVMSAFIAWSNPSVRSLLQSQLPSNKALPHLLAMQFQPVKTLLIKPHR
jgi:hypothetical protein